MPLHFLLRSGGHGVLAWRESRQGQDEIVEAAAQGVPMLRISFSALEMMTRATSLPADPEGSEPGTYR
ncbi:hypothetical protein [Azovibrio sp.]|uniref:hypothetical protein n=1 Tax=Azovibrio sp. TaxID=1872673 RepID=UPI003C7276B1